MRLLFLLTVACLAARPSFAAEPSGCDKFAWPLTREQGLLGAAQAAPGTELDRNAGQAVTLNLAPLADAKLPTAPERQPKKTPALAGYLQFSKAAAPGKYKVSLSEGAWVDVVQDGHYLKPVAFTGATDCAHIRKSVKFDISAAPFTLQVSDAPAAGIAVVVTPAE